MTGGLLGRFVSFFQRKPRRTREQTVRTLLAADVCRRFTSTEIREATQGFDHSLLISDGPSVRIYKGIIHPADKSTVTEIQLAVRRAEGNGIREFMNEIHILSKLRHTHVISLIGYCDDREELILVYDYMANGSFYQYLHKYVRGPILGWRQRLEICIGVARGLHYLHTGARETIIHRDVKTSNILLDENWGAKLGDFTASKTLAPDADSSETTIVVGTVGYLDPEYFQTQMLTMKSDVYSFGVVLFEVLCGRLVYDTSLPEEQVHLANWSRLCYEKGTLEDIVDPALRGRIAPSCFIKFTDTAYRCTASHHGDRPTMEEVLWSLNLALQHHVSAGTPNESLEGNVEDGIEHVEETSSCKSDETSPTWSQLLPGSP